MILEAIDFVQCCNLNDIFILIINKWKEVKTKFETWFIFRTRFGSSYRNLSGTNKISYESESDSKSKPLFINGVHLNNSRRHLQHEWQTCQIHIVCTCYSTLNPTQLNPSYSTTYWSAANPNPIIQIFSCVMNNMSV